MFTWKGMVGTAQPVPNNQPTPDNPGVCQQWLSVSVGHVHLKKYGWNCPTCSQQPANTRQPRSSLECLNFKASPTIRSEQAQLHYQTSCELLIYHPLSTLPVTSHEGVNFVFTTHYQHYLWLCMKVWTLYSPPTINTICDFAWRCELCNYPHQHCLWLHMTVWILRSLPTINTICDFPWRCELCIHQLLSTLLVISHEGVNFVFTTHY